MEIVLAKEFTHTASRTNIRLEHHFDENEKPIGICVVTTVDGKKAEYRFDATQYTYASHYFKEQVIVFL